MLYPVAANTPLIFVARCLILISSSISKFTTSPPQIERLDACLFALPRRAKLNSQVFETWSILNVNFSKNKSQIIAIIDKIIYTQRQAYDFLPLEGGCTVRKFNLETTNKNLLPEVQPQDSNAPEVQTAEDVALIDNTIESIKLIFNKGLTDTYIQIGMLIIEKIYGNNFKDIDFSKGPSKKNQQKHLIFKRLGEEIEKRSGKGEVLPRKTWLYNSVRLVIDQQQLKECKEYEGISFSHKIALLPIEEKIEKEKIVKQITQSNLSVRNTREIVGGKTKSTAKDLVYFINNPEAISNLQNLLDSAFDGLDSKDSIVKPALKAGQNKLTRLKNEIEKHKKEIEKQEKSKEVIEIIIERLKGIQPVADTGRLGTGNSNQPN